MENIESIAELPPLRADQVHVWGVHIPRVRSRLDVMGSVLCEAELEKAARFHGSADRETSIVSRSALRILLSGYSGIPADKIEFAYSANGKPAACDSDLNFNVSHSGDWIVVAIGRDRKIGVDVERIRSDVDIAAISRRYYSSGEREYMDQSEDACTAFFHIWSRKEAYIKARGSALFRELSAFSIPLADGENDGWFFYRLEAGSTYAAALVTDHVVSHLPCYDFGGLKWAY